MKNLMPNVVEIGNEIKTTCPQFSAYSICMVRGHGMCLLSQIVLIVNGGRLFVFYLKRTRLAL
jgi:hypothetical protein